MDAKTIRSHYPTVINSISFRLRVADRLLDQIYENRESEESWIHADSVALQVRKVCELFLLGSTLAHLEEGTGLDPKHWHPSDAFRELQKFNDYPLPFPIRYQLSVAEDGSKQFVPEMKPMTYTALGRVYGYCGNLLHVPSASKFLDEKVHAFDWDKFKGWVGDFTRITRAHVLLLPKIESLIVCRWSGQEGEAPEIIVAEGVGEAALQADGLKDFDLLAL